MSRLKRAIGFLSLFLVMSFSLSVMVTSVKAQIDEVEPDGPEMNHSQVVGCGGVAFRYWEPGCCEGTGGCTDTCNDPIEFCGV